MKRLQGVLILCFCLSWLNAQTNRTGTPLINSLDITGISGDLSILSVTKDKRGVIYFGNESGGVITYDGSAWNLVTTSSDGAVTSLCTDPKGIVFAGGRGDFGMLQPGITGKMSYYSLKGMIGDSSVAANIGTISSIVADTNNILFSDGKRLYMFEYGVDTLLVTDLATNYGLNNAFQVTLMGKRVIIADSFEGVFTLNDGTINPLYRADKPGFTRYLRLIPIDSENLLIAARGKGVQILNIKTGIMKDLLFDKRTNLILRSEKLSDVTLLPGNLVAVGFTNGGGVYIISRDGTLLQHISDKTTSLPHSSVTAIYCDYSSNSQLWFCTEGYVNIASFSLPAGEFGFATGITSMTGIMAEYADSLYVSTADGLLVSFVDGSGIIRFRKSGIDGLKINDLITTDLPGGSVLIAATGNGLFQKKRDGTVTRSLRHYPFTSICSDREDPARIVGGSADGTIRTIVWDGSEWSIATTHGGMLPGGVKVIEQSGPDEWWIVTASPSSLIRMQCSSSGTTFRKFGREEGIMCDTINNITITGDKLYLCTGKGIYQYNSHAEIFEKDYSLTGSNFSNANIHQLFKTSSGDIMLSGYDLRNFDALVTPTSQGHVVFRRQFDFLPDIPTSSIYQINGSLCLAKGKSIYILDKTRLAFSYGTFTTLFTRITSGTGNTIMEDTFYEPLAGGLRMPVAVQPARPPVRLKYADNNISFRWSATSYVVGGKTEYRYKLEGFDSDWSPWERRPNRDYTNLPSGDYRFLVKARTITGFEGEELIYSFSVNRPWWGSIGARLLYILILAWLLYNLVKYIVSRLSARKNRLESLLKQRNEAAAIGRETIAALEKYAGMIQNSILPSEEKLRAALPNSFVIHRPKEEISGDFLWIGYQGERVILAVGDCTGHGLKASFRTITALSLLDEVSRLPEMRDTSSILRELRRRQISLFSSLTAAEAELETVDISLILIDRQAETIEYSGAASQCIRVREMSDQQIDKWEGGTFKPNQGTIASGKYLLETIYGDRIPPDGHFDVDYQYTRQRWKLEKESSYYLFTDGYADQFNGVTGKKFMKANLRKLLLEIQDYPMVRQREILEERLLSWMGNTSQTDDILIAGFRIE